MTEPQAFIFQSYKWNHEQKTLHLRYGFDDEFQFEEVVTFDFDFAENIDHDALDRACCSAWLMAGISYFKAFVPPEVKISQGTLSKSQADFFSKVYQKGLGEFFYMNHMDPKTEIHFPFDGNLSVEASPINTKLEGSLVPFGGGKDSIVTTQMLSEEGEDFETWTVGDHPFGALVNQIGKPHLKIERQLDPKLFELNTNGAKNGHVPITLILSFFSVVSAILRGKQSVIFSNESSASEPTTVYQGVPINHQYAKSRECEILLQKYVHEHIAPNLNIFSKLRELSEVEIAEYFANHCWDDFAHLFASCNRNFHIAKQQEKLSWCGACPKCAFVFALFSPFVEREDLMKVFGKNLFADPDLIPIFNQLLGLTESKPFECVGEVSEVRWAVGKAKASGKWPELDSWNIPNTYVIPACPESRKQCFYKEIPDKPE